MSPGITKRPHMFISECIAMESYMEKLQQEIETANMLLEIIAAWGHASGDSYRLEIRYLKLLKTTAIGLEVKVCAPDSHLNI